MNNKPRSLEARGWWWRAPIYKGMWAENLRTTPVKYTDFPTNPPFSAPLLTSILLSIWCLPLLILLGTSEEHSIILPIGILTVFLKSKIFFKSYLFKDSFQDTICKVISLPGQGNSLGYPMVYFLPSTHRCMKLSLFT